MSEYSGSLNIGIDVEINSLEAESNIDAANRVSQALNVLIEDAVIGKLFTKKEEETETTNEDGSVVKGTKTTYQPYLNLMGLEKVQVNGISVDEIELEESGKVYDVTVYVIRRSSASITLAVKAGDEDDAIEALTSSIEDNGVDEFISEWDWQVEEDEVVDTSADESSGTDFDLEA